MFKSEIIRFTIDIPCIGFLLWDIERTGLRPHQSKPAESSPVS